MHAQMTHPTGTPRQGRHGWLRWRIAWSVAIVAALGLALISSPLVQAKTFHCSASDVQCLIAAINEANASGKQNTIRLEAGTYTLTAVDNMTNGSNGLPSITSPLIIWGAGADRTILERAGNAPLFRLVHVGIGGNLTLEELTIRGGDVATFQSGPPASGAGLLNSGTVTIIDSTIADNRAQAGGGLDNRGTMMIMNSILARNKVGNFGGGGLLNSGTVTIIDSTIADNGADWEGGGLANYGMVTITNSSLADNIAGSESNGGGGLANHGTMTITNSTLASNRAGNFGGGLANHGTMTITNSTLADNSVVPGLRAFGGGIFNFAAGTVALQNTILARNTAPLLPPDRGGGPDCSGLVTSLGNNLIGDQRGCTITLQPTDLAGDPLQGLLDPGLGPFTDDGTPGNGHFPLRSTSRAINAGNDATCPKTDQLGEDRDKPCDIGAIEFQGTTVSRWESQ